jgi:hypothetical protein
MKRIIKILSVSVVIPAVIACKEKQAKSCEIKEIKTLFATVGIHDRDTAYGYYALIKDFRRECMDSTFMVNLALKYSDTVQQGKPVMGVMFFNSDKDFIPNETSQDMDKINKSCLVVIDFDENKGKPKGFIFYNDKGERTYWGDRWLPNGK